MTHQGKNRNPFANLVSLHAPASQSHRPGQISNNDPYYGRRDIANVCARFIMHVFKCPDLPPTTGSPFDNPPISLAKFIAYALHRSRVNDSVLFSALYLLQRLKVRYPAAKDGDGISGHRLFLPALMIASQSYPEYAYSINHWVDVGQGLFHDKQIEGAERELRHFLGNYVEVEADVVREFERRVRRDFAGHGPFPEFYASPSSFSRRPQRQATNIPSPIIVHPGLPFGSRTPGLSASPSTTPVTGMPVTPTGYPTHASVAVTECCRKLPPSNVARPSAIYAKPQGYLW